MNGAGVEPALIDVPQQQLDDLRQRVSLLRLPDDAPVEPWRQGVPQDDLRRLCSYWRDCYNWRRSEALLNSWQPTRATIDGTSIFFSTCGHRSLMHYPC